MPKSYGVGGGGGGWVAWSNLVSAQGPLVLGFWVLGLRGLVPGLDNFLEYDISFLLLRVYLVNTIWKG